MDWHQQVQALIDCGILARRVHDLVMEALEGPPKSDALAEYNQRDKSNKNSWGCWTRSTVGRHPTLHCNVSCVTYNKPMESQQRPSIKG